MVIDICIVESETGPDVAIYFSPIIIIICITHVGFKLYYLRF